jgi:hypothetical protein
MLEVGGTWGEGLVWLYLAAGDKDPIPVGGMEKSLAGQIVVLVGQ